MPKIKAYKGAGSIIPVDVAKIGTAFRCPWTNKIYGDKKSYVKHLRKLRENSMHSRARQLVNIRKKNDLWNQPTFQSIFNWIEMNPEFMFDNGWIDRDRAKYRDKFWIKLTYLDVSWSDSASNSHASPRGKHTNWGGRDLDKDGNPLPRGYPGFTGRIEYTMSHDIGFGSDIMRGLGVHTGTGGGINGNKYGYSVTFFDADWPGLVANRTMDILADNNWKKVKIGKPDYFSF